MLHTRLTTFYIHTISPADLICFAGKKKRRRGRRRRRREKTRQRNGVGAKRSVVGAKKNRAVVVPVAVPVVKAVPVVMVVRIAWTVIIMLLEMRVVQYVLQLECDSPDPGKH